MTEKRDYRDTVFLPKTDFPMKAGLPQKEPGIEARWEEIGVYDDQKQHLIDQAAKIEQEAKAAIVQIKAAARAKLFAELTPDQRKAAEALLGDYFEYEELSFGQQLRKSFKGIGTQSED